jgi:hypothetical protein
MVKPKRFVLQTTALISMTSAIGFVLFALGVLAAFVWGAELVPFFKGVVTLTLLFLGLMCLIIGLGTRKSKKDFAKAINDKPSAAENSED